MNEGTLSGAIEIGERRTTGHDIFINHSKWWQTNTNKKKLNPVETVQYTKVLDEHENRVWQMRFWQNANVEPPTWPMITYQLQKIRDEQVFKCIYRLQFRRIQRCCLNYITFILLLT